MNNRREVRDFLVGRRAKITPEQAGLTAFGSNRRVPGLRREAVATIAGVSVDYCTRLEKGNLVGASESVLDAAARAPQLDDVERVHLVDLSHTANTPDHAPPDAPRRRSPLCHPSRSLVGGNGHALRGGRFPLSFASQGMVAQKPQWWSVL